MDKRTPEDLGRLVHRHQPGTRPGGEGLWRNAGPPQVGHRLGRGRRHRRCPLLHVLGPAALGGAHVRQLRRGLRLRVRRHDGHPLANGGHSAKHLGPGASRLGRAATTSRTWMRFWADWGRGMFGGEAGAEVGRTIQKFDGGHLGINALIRGGAGTTDAQISDFFAPLRAMEALRPRITGAGNLGALRLLAEPGPGLSIAGANLGACGAPCGQDEGSELDSGAGQEVELRSERAASPSLGRRAKL